MSCLPVFAGLALVMLAEAAVAGTGSREALTQLDGYGHFGSGDAALCAYAPVTTEAAGVLSLTAASPAAPALDDGAAAFALQQPFAFFGTDYDTLVVSSNGYVAFAATTADEDGGDFSNDLYLPAVPDNAAFSTPRIYAYHDELSGEGSGAQLSQQYFAACPRASGVIDGEACSVVRWKNWNRLGDNQPIAFELVLYHASAAIALQYTTVDAMAGASACVGLQGADAADGGAWSCNGTRIIAAGSAICLFDPAHLPNANDAIFADDFDG